MGRRKKNVDRQNQLGEILLRLRQERKFSMKKLAQATGVSAAYICRLEAGERNPSRDLLLELIEVLMPMSSQAEKDQVMVAGGFAPANYRNFMGRDDTLSLYVTLVNQDPDDFKAFISLVILSIRSGQHTTARKQIQQGMKHFDDQVQLYALMAALELSQNHYDEAVKYQSQALEYFKSTQAGTLRLTEDDLLLSRGIIHFEEGNAQAYAYQQAVVEKKEKKAEVFRQKALAALRLAFDDFSQALSLHEDVYILDELARVNFTLAFLMDDQEAKSYWEQAVKAFESTVCSNNKAALGYQALLQSTAFLALAYAKSKDFERAWFTLNVIEACLPNYWLIHYMKANYYALHFKQSQVPEDLTHALEALEKAASIDDPLNQAREEAARELDFDVLRQHHNQRFSAFIRGEL